MVTPDRKKRIREEKTVLRKLLGPGERSTADHAIRKNLESLPELDEFKILVAYASDGTEPDLSGIVERFLASGKAVAFPRYRSSSHYDIAKIAGWKDLSGKKWGIPEPGPEAPPCTPDELRNSLWLVPGVAFDDECRRLGRGGGIYDRLLSGRAGCIIGVFYECQNCGAAPSDSHDVPLDMVVTEKRILRRRKTMPAGNGNKERN